MNKVLSCIFITLILTQISEARDWRGLVPLHSTRADVERLLGAPEEGSRNVYKTENERISVAYSEEPCAYGWKVPPGTVVSFSVYPKSPLKVADLKLDVSKYEKRRDYHIESIYYYISEEEGVNYTIDVGGDMVMAVEYYPSAKDKNLRCPSVKDSSSGMKDISKFDVYFGDPTDEKRKLDNFAGLLRQDTTSQGYVMIYAGRRARLNEAEAIATRIKNYLGKTGGLSSGQIVTVDGGHREQVTIELYLVPAGAIPPLPAPTLKPGEVQIIKDRGKRRRSVYKP